jgi:hypothetical protein
MLLHTVGLKILVNRQQTGSNPSSQVVPTMVANQKVAASVNVDADSLYEAIGLAVAEFRSDKLTEVPGAMTEFTVSIERPAVRHSVDLGLTVLFLGPIPAGQIAFRPAHPPARTIQQ